jgi:hypothetical protein
VVGNTYDRSLFLTDWWHNVKVYIYICSIGVVNRSTSTNNVIFFCRRSFCLVPVPPSAHEQPMASTRQARHEPSVLHFLTFAGTFCSHIGQSRTARSTRQQTFFWKVDTVCTISLQLQPRKLQCSQFRGLMSSTLPLIRHLPKPCDEVSVTPCPIRTTTKQSQPFPPTPLRRMKNYNRPPPPISASPCFGVIASSVSSVVPPATNATPASTTTTTTFVTPYTVYIEDGYRCISQTISVLWCMIFSTIWKYWIGSVQVHHLGLSRIESSPCAARAGR